MSVYVCPEKDIVCGDNPKGWCAGCQCPAALKFRKTTTPTEQAENLRSLISDHLTSMYACTRVWEAWGVGTMTEDDFTPARETDFVEDLARAIEAAALTTPPAAPADARNLIEECRAALAVELTAWDIEPPLHHVKQAHDKCVAWLAASPPAAPATGDVQNKAGKCVGVAGPKMCENLKCTYEGMDGERYRCDVCGRSYFLDYEDMK